MKKIHVESEKCSGCRICELVCSFHHEGRFNPRLSRVAVVKEDKYGLDYPVFCHQCKPCPVIAACPSDALKRGALGVIYVDEEACTKLSKIHREERLKMEFKTRTGKVIIDDNRCLDCDTYACVKACSHYGRFLYRINLKTKKPELSYDKDNLKRLCTECLACEQECFLRGLKAIKIILPMPELEEFRKKTS